MYSEIRNDHEAMWAAMNAVAGLLGVGSGETVRVWVPRAEVDTGSRPG
jgi:transposase